MFLLLLVNCLLQACYCLYWGENLALLFLGWEGVGLCSYLLIGHHDQTPSNGLVAIKAFTVTRVGDVFLPDRFVLALPTIRYLEHAQYIVENAATVMTQSCLLPCGLR